MARPAKRTKDQKTSHLHIRLTDELKKKLELAAAREGMDLSTFARSSMIARARSIGVEI
jgi:uncharacterized protein (DUF1778 family)